MSADTENLGPIAVVGAGKVGGALHAAARSAGLDVRLLGRGEVESVAADVVILAVPDREIRSACSMLCGAARLPRLVGHTSGATSLEALSEAAERGATTFSMHPLQTFTGPGEPLREVPCAVTAAEESVEHEIGRLVTALGMSPFRLDDESRVGYHAAASIASNFLIALEETAVEALRRLGVAEARELLVPLVSTTVRNWAEFGGDALTGPIARGDEETVAAHLEWIEREFGEIEGLYRELAERARIVAAAEASS